MQDKKTTLVLFTFNYPFGKGEQFIATEVSFLLQKFDRVIILPFNASGPARSIPEGVLIDLSIKRPGNILLYFIEIALRGLVSPLLYKEIVRDPLSALVVPRLLRMVQYIGNAIRIKKRILSLIENFDIDLEYTIFYTYWISFLSYGVGLAKSDYPNLILISRAHSGDIYEIEQQPPYFPFRPKSLSLIDRIYCVSNHAKRYLTERYPNISNRCEVSKLGVVDPGFDTAPSVDATLHIISCSFFAPKKRIDLLIQGIGRYATSDHSRKIVWQHIGDGPLHKSLENLACIELPDNVRWAFLSYVPHPEVYQFYKKHPVDVMINVSNSEGISVAIMEAQSCGIPVIATSVGGTPEIVTDRNGILLRSDPTPQEIAEALSYIATNNKESLAMRRESKNTWNTMYNAKNNYQDFANRLFKLISER